MSRRLLACIALLMGMMLGLQAQSINIKLDNVSVKDAINAVSQETGYSIVVNSGTVDLDRKVSVNAQNASIADVVNQIFKGQDISFVTNGKTVAVEKKQVEQPKPAAQPSAKSGGCAGKVVDAAGEPLAGVVVMEKGTNNNTISDIDGNFFLKAKGGATIVLSCLGYQDQEVVAEPMVSVKMKDSIEYLDEAVAIGYGTMRKKDITGAISHVNAIESQASAPPAVNDILRGRVAGLHVWQSPYVSGESVTIKVRAAQVMSGSSDALVVLDGAIYTGLIYDINPADIESIDVMKDASAAAVYGSNAAMGVILITTKKGETGKPKINFNNNIGFAQNWSRARILDGPGFLDILAQKRYSELSSSELAGNEFVFDDPRGLSGDKLLHWYNYGRAVKLDQVPSEVDLVSVWMSRLGRVDREIECYKNGIETDWADYLYPKAALQQQYQVSVSNRNEKNSYYISASYTNKEGARVGMGYEAISARVNIDSYINKWLTVGMNTMLNLRDNSQVQTQDDRLVWSPYTTNEIDNPDSPYYRYTTGSGITNPFLAAKYTDKFGKNISLNSNVYGKVILPWGFEFKSTFTPTFLGNILFTHKSSKNPQWQASNIQTEREHQDQFNWQLDNVLSWNQTFGNHRIEASFIQNAEKRLQWVTRAQGWDFSPSDVLSYHGLYNSQSSSVGSNDTYSTADALVGRLFYQFKGRYSLNATVRRDGYSEFGADLKTGVFPAMAGSWTFSEEPFAKKWEWLDYGKIRLSWGINGHRNLSVGEGLAKVSVDNRYLRIDQDGKGYAVAGSMISASNTGLRWESAETKNFGLDFGLFDGFVDGTVDAYTTDSYDLIAQRTMPVITGFGGTWDLVKANVGHIKSRGVELSLKFHPVKTSRFRWDSSLIFELYDSRLISLGYGMQDVLDEDGNVIGQKEADDVSAGWYVGHLMTEVRDYEPDGVWQLDEAEEAAKYGFLPGDFKYVDQNNDGVLSDDDKIFMNMNRSPVYLSWSNDVTLWKNLSVSCLMYAYLKVWGAFNQAANQIGSNINWYDQPIWTPDNPRNDYARLNSVNVGNHYIRRDFLRIENITVTYTLPKDWLKKSAFTGASLTASVRNPFMITKWPMGDPESERNPFYGIRTFNLGINFSL